MPTKWIMEFCIDHFWFVATLFTLIHYLRFRVVSIENIRQDPRLAEGYARLLKGYLSCTLLPWLIMGCGQVFGGVYFRDYLNPSAENLFVLIWYTTVLILWLLISYWILFRGGAAFISKYPGALPASCSSPTTVRVYWLILTSVGGMVLFMIFNMWAPGMRPSR